LLIALCLISAGPDLDMRHLKVKHASRSAIGILAVELKDLNLDERILVVDEDLPVVGDLLSDDQLRWEVPDDL